MSDSPVDYSIPPGLARDPYRDRRPPYSEDAEQAVISAMLIDQDAVLRAVRGGERDHRFAPARAAALPGAGSATLTFTVDLRPPPAHDHGY